MRNKIFKGMDLGGHFGGVENVSTIISDVASSSSWNSDESPPPLMLLQ